MLSRTGFELAPLGYRSVALPVDLSSPQGSKASFIQFKCTRYSRDNLKLIHERICSVSIPFQIILKSFCSCISVRMILNLTSKAEDFWMQICLEYSTVNLFQSWFVPSFISRTGRAGNKGTAYTFITLEQGKLVSIFFLVLEVFSLSK